jgi:hypothetical protein
MDTHAVEVIVVAVFCLVAFISVIVAIGKGRSLAWCIPCILFPPLLIVLFKLPEAKRAGQVRCEACLFWNPVERNTCARCGFDLADPDYAE